jgi:hypothetical protein
VAQRMTSDGCIPGPLVSPLVSSALVRDRVALDCLKFVDSDEIHAEGSWEKACVSRTNLPDSGRKVAGALYSHLFTELKSERKKLRLEKRVK